MRSSAQNVALAIVFGWHKLGASVYGSNGSSLPRSAGWPLAICSAFKKSSPFIASNRQEFCHGIAMIADQSRRCTRSAPIKPQQRGPKAWTVTMHQNELDGMRAPAIWFRRYAGKASLSKLGGLPTLPPRTDWPRQRQSGTPLHFLRRLICRSCRPLLWRMLRTHQLFREAASYSSLPIWWRRCCGVKTVAPLRQPVSFSPTSLDPNARRRTIRQI